MARKIVITSGKGGVGKTTIAVQLALQLAKKGQRVLLCDGDFTLNNVDIEVGVEGLVVYDLVDVIEGRCRAKQALIKHPKQSNLFIMTSGHASSERYLSPQSVKLVLDGLAPSFDFILVDSPTGVDEGFHRAIATADEAIVVATTGLAALRDADKVITLLKSYQLKSLSLLVNRVRGELLLSKECLSPADIAALLKLPLIGVFPEDERFFEGEERRVHTAAKYVVNNLLTGKKKLYDVSKKYSGFFGNIRRILKRSL